MAFHDRQYRCYLVLGDPSSLPLWESSRWLEFAGAFDTVITRCRDKPLLRVGQFTKEEKRKEVKFGRLFWSRESFEKWTHSSSIAGSRSASWEFFHVEVSAPSLPAAAREGVPPDFFLVVTNEGWGGRKIPLAFNPKVLVAIATDMPEDVAAACRSAISEVERMVASRFSATIIRPWGYPVGSFGGFQDAIQDIAHVGLFKVGQPHTRPLDLETLTHKWEILK